jgi:hypothetical protein
MILSASDIETFGCSKSTGQHESQPDGFPQIGTHRDFEKGTQSKPQLEFQRMLHPDYRIMRPGVDPETFESRDL